MLSFYARGETLIMSDGKPDEMLTTTKAGRVLGVGPKTVIRLIESGQLPAYRINYAWRIRRSDVEAYLEAHKYRPGQELDKP
jgi:excisionase family DNA binding protein